jgi:hypothetical protein
MTTREEGSGQMQKKPVVHVFKEACPQEPDHEANEPRRRPGRREDAQCKRRESATQSCRPCVDPLDRSPRAIAVALISVAVST